MDVVFKEHHIILHSVTCLNLDLTLDCGQAFRWSKQPDGSWSGIAGGRQLNIAQKGTTFLLKNTTRTDFETFWRHYFDLDRNYDAICSRLKEDALLAQTVEDYYGIRILQQDSWEALCTFVISQNNNIKRIKGIISKLCRTYGDALGADDYAFPSARQLAGLTAEDFTRLGAGYRAPYLAQLARDVADGKIDLQRIRTLPLEDARKALLSIRGVGVKVADCALLFGFGFLNAFPVDVWMKRALTYYPNGLPACFKGYEGVAQQYLFHWARNHLGQSGR